MCEYARVCEHACVCVCVGVHVFLRVCVRVLPGGFIEEHNGRVVNELLGDGQPFPLAS